MEVSVQTDFKEQMRSFYASFYKFCGDCLGHKENKKLSWANLTKDHEELCNFLQHDPHKFKLVLMPRYSLKSCIVTIGYALWRTIKNPNIRILIYSDTEEKAFGFLGGIKNHLMGIAGNSRFNEFFPSWDKGGNSSSRRDSLTVRTRDAAEKEPTFDTAGIDATKVGCHYDLIIYDDIVSDMNITSRQMMDKVWDCYKRSLSLLKPGGDVVCTGTRWNVGDSYGRMIEEQRHNKDWKTFIRKAEKEDGSYPFELIGLNRDFLKMQKERQGSYTYACLYQNEPIDPSTAFFYKDNFKFYRPPVNTDPLYKTCVVDPAGDGEDCTAIVVVGTNDRLKMYVLDAVNRHLQPNQIVSEIMRLSYTWGFTQLGIEINFFRNLERDIQNEIEANRQNHKFTPFSITELTATAQRHSGKHARILSLQPFHERGDLFFPNPEEHPKIETCDGAISELISQMMQYTQNHRPMHDDLIDALSYHIRLIQRGTGEAKEEIPQDTIASIINRDITEHNRMQRRFPFRHRKYLEPVFMGE